MTAKVGGFGLVALAVFIASSFIFQLTSTPPRTLSGQLDPYGEVKLHLETQPDPPKTGNIPLVLHITDGKGNAVAVDKVQYEYMAENHPAQTIAGEPVETGQYRAIAALSGVGEWEIRVTLFKGSQQTQVKFLLRVMPNI